MEQGILSDLRFPLVRSTLWNEAPKSRVETLHLTAERSLIVTIPSRTLNLAWKYVEKSHTRGFRGFFVGVLSHTKADGEGVVVEITRFDPGKPDCQGKKQPTVCAPGDFIIPVKFCESPPDSDSTVCSRNDYAEGVKNLHMRLGESTPASKFFVQATCCTAQAPKFLLTYEAVMLSSSVEVSQIGSIPIIPTALARALSAPYDCLQEMGIMQSGYLTMDQTRKLLLVLQTDPKAKSLPLVGIWLSGIASVSHPLVWATSIAFAHNPDLAEKVLTPTGLFIVLLYPPQDPSRPQFWGCKLKPEPVWACAHKSQQIINTEEHCGVTAVELIPDLESPQLVEALRHAEKRLQNRCHAKDGENFIQQPAPVPQPTVNPYSTLLVLPKPAVPDVSLCGGESELSVNSEQFRRKPLDSILNRTQVDDDDDDDDDDDVSESKESLSTSETPLSETESQSDVFKMLQSQKEQLESLQLQVKALMNERSDTAASAIDETKADDAEEGSITSSRSSQSASTLVVSSSSASSSSLSSSKVASSHRSDNTLDGFESFAADSTSIHTTTGGDLLDVLNTPALGESASQASFSLPSPDEADEEDFYEDVLRKLSDVLGDDGGEESGTVTSGVNVGQAQPSESPKLVESTKAEETEAVIQTLFGTYSKKWHSQSSSMSLSCPDATFSCVNETFDETAQLADAISLQYLTSVSRSDAAKMIVSRQLRKSEQASPTVPTTDDDKDEVELSHDSREYWKKYGLFSGVEQPQDDDDDDNDSNDNQVHKNILDVRKLKELPKLL